MATFFQVLSELVASGEPFVTVTLVDTAGSTPQDRGAKMIVTSDGLRLGTVGGGKVETKAIGVAQEMLRPGGETTRFVTWNLGKDVGMTCAGVVKLYFESMNVARWNVVVFGAGHVAQALATLLVHFDCQLLCIDPREEWLARLPQSPRLTAVRTADMAARVAALPEDAFVVLMTMGHATDLPVLLEVLRTRNFPFVGVIGSRSKAAVLRRDLAAAGVGEELQQAFHCPVGLELGTNHPYEIALSVIAQMIQVRDASRESGAAEIKASSQWP